MGIGRRSSSAVLCAAMALGACGDDTRLDGSIAELLSLQFNQLELQKLDGFLVVQYLQRGFEATEIVCKHANRTSALPEERVYGGQAFSDNVTLSRAALDSSRFPDIDQETLRLPELELEHDGAVVGSFDLLFVNQRTLSGDFAGTLVEIQLR